MKRPQNRMATDREVRVGNVQSMQVDNIPSPPKPRGIWQGPAVSYAPAQCPNCTSADCPIDDTYRHDPELPGVRYRLHTCHKCGTRFKSLQEVPQIDQPH